METRAVEALAEESLALKKRVLEELSFEVPSTLEHLFNDTNLFFQEETLGQWRDAERYDELIDVILYQYSEQGGETFWKQVLLDLRLKGETNRAIRLLEGLFKGRLELFKSALKNSKKFPDNYLSSANLATAKGEVMKVLYEHAFILENQSRELRDESKIKKIKAQIEKILNRNH